MDVRRNTPEWKKWQHPPAVRKCPKCQTFGEVYRTQDLGTVVVRYRRCRACKVWWRTKESLE